MAAATRDRVQVGTRLAYYWQAADLRFWEDHWGRPTKDYFAAASRGHLDLPTRALRWLPKKGKILEAGCGPGTVVMALRVRGYDIEGVEWAADLVEQVHAVNPDLPIRAGDVTALSVPDGAYAACLSLGVCEHREAGPEPFVCEAYRVIEPGGIFLVSVPHFHALRRAVFGRWGRRRGVTARDFYQWAFTPREFRSLLTDAGFEVIDRSGYGVWYGLCDDFVVIRRVAGLPVLGDRLQSVADSLPLAPRWLGHMMLFVARKPRASA